MAVQDAATLKGYFNTGDTPTEAQFADLIDTVDSKQATLVSGTNIKTINSTSLLGSGDITVGGSSIPVQASAPSNPSDGDLWIDSDASPSGGGASADLLEAEVVVETATTSVTFSDLDGNAAGGYVLSVSIKNATTSDAVVKIYHNGDTTDTNYGVHQTNQYNTYAHSTFSNTPFIFPLPAQGGAYQQVGIINADAVISVGNSRVSWVSECVYDSYLSAQENYPHKYTIYGCKSAADVSNLTSITLTATSANTIDVGSIFRLYRRK